MDAAIRAPSGSNAQSWLFVVVKDAEQRRKLGAVYKKASEILLKLYEGAPRPEHMDQQKHERFLKAVVHLFDHMGDAPVLLVACLKSRSTCAHIVAAPLCAAGCRTLSAHSPESLGPSPPGRVVALAPAWMLPALNYYAPHLREMKTAAPATETRPKAPLPASAITMVSASGS